MWVFAFTVAIPISWILLLPPEPNLKLGSWWLTEGTLVTRTGDRSVRDWKGTSVAYPTPGHLNVHALTWSLGASPPALVVHRKTMAE